MLLLGNYRPTISVARALSRCGWRVIVGIGGGEGGAEFSQAVSEVWDHPPLVGDGRAVGAELARLLAGRPDIAAVLPVTEEFVVWLARHPDVVPSGRLVASPEPGIIATCFDKVAMLRLARAHAVPCEPFAVVERHGDILPAACSTGYPVVVRPLPSGSRLGASKAVIAAAPGELAAQFPRWPAGPTGLLIQRRAVGHRRNVYFAAHRGAIFAALETRILRTDSHDGTGLAVDGVTVPLTPLLLAHCQTMAQALAYTGVGLAQFIVDEESGRICFLELNPRISGSHAVAEQAGLELSRLAVTLAAGAEPSAADRAYRPPAGLRYAWTYGDLRGLKSALVHRQIGLGAATLWLWRALWTGLAADMHMTWCWTDPRPALMLFWRALGGPCRAAATAQTSLRSGKS